MAPPSPAPASVARGLDLRCDRLALHGQSDVIEFHRDGRVIPIEYKRGKPKSHRADEVQLCAQALCLEEMLTVTIPEGHLYYGKTRRRTTVALDPDLRTLTESLARRLHTMIADRETPPAIYEKKKCSACSLIDDCLPRLTQRPQASKWFEKNLTTALTNPVNPANPVNPV